MIDYETFSSDLPTEGRVSFGSVEENEGLLRSHGLDVAARQMESGQFLSDLVVGNAGEAVFFSQRVKVALTMHARWPSDSVLILFPRRVSGRYSASGIELGSEKLLLLPEGETVDLSIPGLSGSDSILFSTAHYLEMAAALCPNMDTPQIATVLELTRAEANLFRYLFTGLIAQPGLDSGAESSAALLARVVSCLGDAVDDGQSVGLQGRRTRGLCARTARDFIEDNYREEVRIDDLCRATGVGVRTLQRSFRAYFGISISEYLKTVRLNSVYRALVAADPSTTTVTQVGVQNGCTHLGRLSGQFHERFGKFPREVLSGTET